MNYSEWKKQALYGLREIMREEGFVPSFIDQHIANLEEFCDYAYSIGRKEEQDGSD